MEAKIIKNSLEKIYECIEENNYGDLIKLLSRLGKLTNDFDKKPLLKILEHDNERIRTLAVKSLTKLGDDSLVNVFVNIVEKDNSSNVRREAIFAIGRLRNISNKQILFKYLYDSDPEVVLQAIRGLLVFKEDTGVKKRVRYN